MTRLAALRCATAIALLLLAGCTSLPQPSPPTGKEAPPSAQAVERPFHEVIDISGRLSVRYQNGDREESVHGSFTWTQSPSQTTVTLLSPLGQTIAIIDVTPEGATLMRGGEPPRSADDVDALTASTLGWPLPVAGLRDWLQGFAVDRSGRRFIATPFATETTTNDGWRLHYASWADNARPDRPKRIDIARFTEQAGDVAIRIVIDTWQIP